jgi:hypothetical protein
MSIGILIRLARALPQQGRMVYCLYRDSRTPLWWKAGLAAALFVVWVPSISIDWIPVIGQMEWLAVTLLAVRFSVARAPKHLVEEHEAAIAAGTSLFHRDFGQLRHRIDSRSQEAEYKTMEKR